MARLHIKFDDTGLTREESEEFASEVGASSFRFEQNRTSKQSSLDLTFENRYDGDTILEYYDNAQGYLEFDDGTVSRHYVRRERTFDD